jgi:hypothetical protein
MDDETVERFPCRILLFLKDIDGEILTLVQSTESRDQFGTMELRQQHLYETHLSSRWLLQSKRVHVGGKYVRFPRAYLVPSRWLQESIIVVEQEPGLAESWEGNRYIWTTRDRRREWPSMFPLVAEELTNVDDNSTEPSSGGDTRSAEEPSDAE